ncbi:MAG: hypothetical protein LBP56_06930 [Odoribacteraceae bacterium]|jgi:hypothetical protein|nr:hypothetical protein [Odoribacteraceae bacterium]
MKLPCAVGFREIPAVWLLFHPAAGYRHVAAGTMDIERYNGHLWSSTSVSYTFGHDLCFATSVVYPQESNHRGNGFPARRVQAFTTA